MPKIAFFTHYGDWKYGSNRSLINLIDGLQEYDVEALVVSPKQGSLGEALSSRRVPFLVVPFARWMTANQSWFGSLRRLRRNLLSVKPISKQLLDWGCDLLYTNSSVIPIGAFVSMWIDKPHIWHIREFGELDWGLKRDWSDWIFQWFMAKATTIAVSQAVCEEVLPINIAQRTTVVYNGIAFERDFDRFLELSKARQNRTQPFTFAIIGAIRPSKGQYEAIQAFSQVVAQNSAVRLLIVGDGEKEYVAMCKGLVDTYGIAEKVEFCGYKPDPYKAMFAADAILMCSQNEGMGRVTVEAMSACRPVIGFDQAGTSELIEHGKNGLLYHGIQELIDCMLHLAGNPLLGEEMGRYGWELARKKYTVEKYAEQVYQVVRSVYQSQGSK